MELVFATANRHKIEEAQAIIGNRFKLVSPADLGYTAEIPETGCTLEANALQKASHIWEQFGKPCFADDTGLEIDALNGAPGVHSARYASQGHDFKANMDKVLEQMQYKTERTARFRCVIAYIDATGSHCFEGSVEGSILTEPWGKGGFGYDPIFVPEGYTQSFAELSPQEKNSISHRGLALEKFTRFLNEK